jgi:DNA-binding NtrC family response regulator
VDHLTRRGAGWQSRWSTGEKLTCDRLADVGRDQILAVLEATGGNRAKAAERLEIGEATLYRRLKERRSRSTAME